MQAIRLRRALIILACGALAIALTQAVLDGSRTVQGANRIEAWALSDKTDDVTGFVSTYLSSPAGNELPEGFAEEVCDLSGAQVVQADLDALVVGCEWNADAEACFAELQSRLVSRGWTMVPSGSATAASFVKKEGRYRWIFVSCTEIAHQTSVVFQLAT